MEVLTLQESDYGYNLVFNLKDKDCNVLDLSTATSVHFQAGVKGQGLRMGGACAIIDALNGQCAYQLTEYDTIENGKWFGQVKVNFADATQIVQDFMVVVNCDLSKRGVLL